MKNQKSFEAVKYPERKTIVNATMIVRQSTSLASAVILYFLFTFSAGLSRFGQLVSFARGEEACEASIGPGYEALSPAEAKISEFLQSNGSGGKFYVQGWRWHTMSLVREAGRLEKLALKLQKSDSDEELISLKKASDYVVGFNMKGLHKIERDLFFPWFREKIDSSMKNAETKKAFSTMMDQLESDRKAVAKLGVSVVSESKVHVRNSFSFFAYRHEFCFRASSPLLLPICLRQAALDWKLSELWPQSLKRS